MKRESVNSTDSAAGASTNLIPAPALVMSAPDLDSLRAYLRTIAGTAGNEPASEAALDTCGRYAARALALINSLAQADQSDQSANAPEGAGAAA